MKSYFKFLSRNKAYTFINVAGLVVSLMFIILMGKENYFFLWSQAAEGIGATCPDVEQTCCVMSQNGRIGRQTPQHYEVLEGLESGERVVTSGYEAFKDNEVLVLN